MIGQTVTDSASLAQYGIRSWSALNLITDYGIIDASGDLEETRKFAQYYVSNYGQPQNRISEIGFRSMRPGDTGASENWRLLSLVDISDEVTVTVASPGGGGFSAQPYFVEGIHEQVGPLTPDYDDVTLTLDLSPRAYFAFNPFPVGKVGRGKAGLTARGAKVKTP